MGLRHRRIHIERLPAELFRDFGTPRHRQDGSQVALRRRVVRRGLERRGAPFFRFPELAHLGQRRPQIAHRGSQPRVQPHRLPVALVGFGELLAVEFQVSEIHPGFGVLRFQPERHLIGRHGPLAGEPAERSALPRFP